MAREVITAETCRSCGVCCVAMEAQEAYCDVTDFQSIREAAFQRHFDHQLDQGRKLHEELRKRETAKALLAAIIRAAERRLSVAE